jgi:hypothetical protein
LEKRKLEKERKRKKKKEKERKSKKKKEKERKERNTPLKMKSMHGFLHSKKQCN